MSTSKSVVLGHFVGTIQTIPSSSQSLAIDDLKRRYCCSPRECSSPTTYCERLALPVSLLIVIYFKATTKHEEKPPRPEPHTNKYPLRGSHILPASRWILGKSTDRRPARSAIKAPTHSLVGHSVTITMSYLTKHTNTPVSKLYNTPVSFTPILPYLFTPILPYLFTPILPYLNY
jgi:hypothetical protein